MQNKLNSALRWLLALCMLALIYFLSSTQGAREILPEEWLGTFFHEILSAGAHMILYGLLALALEWGFGTKDKKSRLLILLIVVLYGITDEIHQSFVPERNATVLDVIYDFTGGWLVIYRQKIISWIKTRNTT